MAHLCEGFLPSRGAIKVAGSNGKGSVATFTAEILRAQGLRVGLTLSPHVVHPGERIQIDGRPEAPRELSRAWSVLRPRLEASPSPPLAFEAITALALAVFERAGVEAVVAEAGIGGRHDATRILEGSVTALVSVDLEHSAILGSTLEAIAADKADLADPGSELILGSLPRGLTSFVARHSAARGVRAVRCDDRVAVEARKQERGGGQSFELHDLRAGRTIPGIRLAASGRHQATNAALAVCLAQRFLGGGSLCPAAIRRGLKSSLLPGRFERVRRQPPVFVDVAHTPHAARLLARHAREAFGRRPILVLGVSADKKAGGGEVAAPLLDEAAERVWVTRAEERGGDPRPLLRIALERGLEAEILLPLGAALDGAIAEAERRGLPVLVAGGLFVAREALAYLRDSSDSEDAAAG
ncbi:MAG: cyanophycin synthetase [Acidobacteriota bacterium]